MVLNSAFVTRTLDSTILLDLSASEQLFAIFITSCCWSYWYLNIFYHFFYNNRVFFCISKYHHWGEELLCIHNFQGLPIGLCNPEKDCHFWSPLSITFWSLLPTYQNSCATILPWLSLPNDGIIYFLMELKIPIFWNIIFNCCFFLTMMWWWHQASIGKFRNILQPIALLISLTTWQDDGSKFFWLSKSPTCSGSNSQGWMEIYSCLIWTD